MMMMTNLTVSNVFYKERKDQCSAPILTVGAVSSY